MVSWATQGNKSLSLSVTQNECVSDVANADLSVAYPFEGEQICLVTIDLETGKNMVVWEKTHGVGIAATMYTAKVPSKIIMTFLEMFLLKKYLYSLTQIQNQNSNNTSIRFPLLTLAVMNLQRANGIAIRN